MSRSVGLVLDLSCAGFLAVCDVKGLALSKRWRPAMMRHDDLGDWVGECLVESQSDFTGVEWMAVGVGPGSFTGLRIALAFAQGLALPRKLLLYGFNSFAPLLLSASISVNTVAVLPSNAGRFYAATSLTDPGQVVTLLQLMEWGEQGKTLVLPCDLPVFAPLYSGFKTVEKIQDQWNVTAVFHHSQTSGYEATKPYYLTLPAAELNLKPA